METMKRVAILICSTAAALGIAAAPATAAPSYGVVNQGILGDTDFERMEQGGVETLRFLIRWRQVEPTPGAYDWSSVDSVVAGAEAHGIRLLPIVYGSPEWIDEAENHAPVGDPDEEVAWQGFVTALATRYGSTIRRWQIWNEPNFDVYWEPPQSAAAYARLVEISAASIRAVNPRARIVLAGVAAVRDGTPWAGFLRDVYAVRGVRRSFDFVGFHPYSPNIRILRAQIERIRRLLDRVGDPRARLAITEIGWASDGERPRPLVVGPQMQASLLRRSFALLSQPGRGWHISDVQWYAWQDSRAIEDLCVFCEHAGLFDFDGQPKLAWAAFRRAVR